MNQLKIAHINKSEYEEVVDVWEASVRATHSFLKEEDIAYFRPLILNEYLDAVELRCTKNSNREIIGFLGVAGQNLEMLFIHPNERGKGVGKQLLMYALQELGVKKVDVNEENEQAVGFIKSLVSARCADLHWMLLVSLILSCTWNSRDCN